MLKTMTFVLVLAVSAGAAELPTSEPRPALTVLLPQPVRVLDTRVPECQIKVVWPPESNPGWCVPGPLHDGEVRYLNQQCRNGVPFMAKGVILTVAAVEATGVGRLLLYDPFPVVPGAEAWPDERRPEVTSLNFAVGQTTSSLVFLALGQWQFQAIGIPMYPDSAIYARLPGGGSVHVVIDMVGYLQ